MLVPTERRVHTIVFYGSSTNGTELTDRNKGAGHRWHTKIGEQRLSFQSVVFLMGYECHMHAKAKPRFTNSENMRKSQKPADLRIT